MRCLFILKINPPQPVYRIAHECRIDPYLSQVGAFGWVSFLRDVIGPRVGVQIPYDHARELFILLKLRQTSLNNNNLNEKSPQYRDVVSFDRRRQVVTCSTYPRSGLLQCKRGLSPTWSRHVGIQYPRHSAPGWWTASWILSKTSQIISVCSLG